MVEIDVYRHQYGVGQGNFHVQELAFAGPKIPNRTYRFVYDCGGYPNVIKWCVKHATQGPQRLEINAIYLSHFESDHINGLTALCANANVLRVYAPHIDKAQAAHILAMQISNAGAWTVELQSFVSTVVAVASGGLVNGVPVTLIRGGDAQPDPQSERSTEPLTDLDRDGGFTLSAPKGAVATHAERVTIGLPIKGGATRIELWEMVHWYYAGHTDISNGILAAFRTAFKDFKTKIEPGLELNATLASTATTLTWMQNNFKAVAAVYVSVMKLHNDARVLAGLPKIPDDHNVASLCLYSGPVPANARLKQYMSRPPTSAYFYSVRSGLYTRLHLPSDRTAWLATGDAMLKTAHVWDDFERHFSAIRLDRCATVQIPHHGADAPSSNNYNPKLIRHHQNCVISAGGISNHGHPHKNVVQSILAKPAILQLVTENDPMGFIEYLKFKN